MQNRNKLEIKFKKKIFLRNSRRKSGVGKMNGTAITNRLQNSFKIKDNNVYGSSYYGNFRTSSFKQVACLILLKFTGFKNNVIIIKSMVLLMQAIGDHNLF